MIIHKSSPSNCSYLNNAINSKNHLASLKWKSFQDEHPPFSCAGGPQEAVHQPGVVRGGGGKWSELSCLFSHHRSLRGGTIWLPLLHPLSSPARFRVWASLVLSPTSHPVEEHESRRFLALRTPLTRAAPPRSPGFQNGNSKRLEKGCKAKTWLHGVRPLCNSTEHGGTAKFQATWSSLQIS